MKALDVRGQGWNQVVDNCLARFTTKKAAADFAKRYGWRSSDCIKADNRFCSWWLIGQQQSTETMSFLNQSGAVVILPLLGYW
jgi:hypothetical protein